MIANQRARSLVKTIVAVNVQLHHNALLLKDSTKTHAVANVHNQWTNAHVSSHKDGMNQLAAANVHQEQTETAKENKHSRKALVSADVQSK